MMLLPMVVVMLLLLLHGAQIISVTNKQAALKPMCFCVNPWAPKFNYTTLL